MKTDKFDIIKRTLCIVLCLTMIIALTPAMDTGVAYASQTVEYLAPVYVDNNDVKKGVAGWETKSKEQCNILTDSDSSGIIVQDAWFYTSGNFTINGTLTINKNVNLILVDGSTLKVTGGIICNQGATLTIYAQSTGTNMGKLIATGKNNVAGIGGSSGNSNGKITINGGDINVTGGEGAAGIGGGYAGTGSNIIINGGKIKSTGGNNSAGIGGGYDKKAYDIVINSSIVIATGGDYGAGIGAGGWSSAWGISISNSTITSTGGNEGAGIGGGARLSGIDISICNSNINATGGNGAAGIGGGSKGGGLINATITNSTIDAEGNNGGAGIGGGNDGNASNIVINNSTVVATGSSYIVYGDKHGAAGIGGGADGDASDIAINNSTVTSTGGEDGAGIGGGFDGNVSDIAINNSTVTSTGGGDGAGIGGGRNYKSTNKGGTTANIIIENSTIIATGGTRGAGIGGGCYNENCSNIVIKYGNITAVGGEGAAGIGGGDEGNISGITIVSSTVTAAGGNYGAGIGGGDGKNAEYIIIDNSTVNATGGSYESYGGAAGIGGGRYASLNNATITNSTITSIGGQYAAGIGGGRDGSLNNLTIVGGFIIACGSGTDTKCGAGIGGGRNSSNDNYGATSNIRISNNMAVLAGSGTDAAAATISDSSSDIIDITGNISNINTLTLAPMVCEESGSAFKRYASVYAALKYVTSGNTIKLLKNATTDKDIKVSGDAIFDLNDKVLNLNNHHIEVPCGQKLDINGGNVTGGYGVSGGAILVNENAAATITNVTLNANKATNGGSIYAGTNSSLTITNSTITDSTASDYGGGLYSIGGNITLNDTAITQNTASKSGGGVYFRSDSSHSKHIEVSGAVYIKGNTCASGNSNLDLDQQSLVIGNRKDAIQIGITAPDSSIFTASGCDVKDDDVYLFFADDDNHHNITYDTQANGLYFDTKDVSFTVDYDQDVWVNAGDQMLRGTVESGAAIQVDGNQAATESDTSWHYLFPADSGILTTHMVRASKNDGSGKTSSINIKVKVDVTQPAIAAMTIKAVNGETADVLNCDSFNYPGTISAKVKDSTSGIGSVAITVNGETVSAYQFTKSGNYTGNIDGLKVNMGDVVRFEITDVAGNVTTRTLTIESDTAPATITSMIITEGASSSDLSISDTAKHGGTISATFTDAVSGISSIHIISGGITYVNGNNYTFSINNGGLTGYLTGLTGETGDDIKITVTDKAGNVLIKSITIKEDSASATDSASSETNKDSSSSTNSSSTDSASSQTNKDSGTTTGGTTTGGSTASGGGVVIVNPTPEQKTDTSTKTDTPAVGKNEIKGQNGTLKITTTVTGSTVTLGEISLDMLQALGTGEDLIIDLSGLGKNLTALKMSRTTADNIASFGAKGFVIRYSDGVSARFGKNAFKAAASQAAGEDLTISLVKGTQAQSKLTAAQQSTLKGMGNSTVLSAEIKSGDMAITDFNGGTVTLSADYTTSKYVRVWYLMEDGTKQRVTRDFDGKTVSFYVGHFSQYVLEEFDGKGVSSEDVLSKISLRAKTAYAYKNGKRYIKVTATADEGNEGLQDLKDMGYTLKYTFYRGTSKKSSTMSEKLTKTSASYLNTSGTQNKKYYYRVSLTVCDPNGRTVGGVHYSKCKYGSRLYNTKEKIK